jgi:hypothetical protein
MGEEDSGAEQSHHRSHCLEHCKPSLARPSHAQKTVAALHSQKDSGRKNTKPWDRGFSATGVSKGGSKPLLLPANLRESRVTIGSPPQSSPHFRRVPVAISLGVDAEVGRIVAKRR